MNKIVQFLTDKPNKSACIAGALLTLAFAPFALWPLALLSLGVLFYVLLRTSTLKQAFVVGFLFSFVHQVTALHWIPMSFYMDSGVWWLAVLGGIPAVLGLAFYVTLFSLPAVLAVYLLKDKKWLAVLAFVSLWMLGELLRSVGSLAFPWNLMGYVWASDLNMMQLASVGHVWLLSALVLLSSALLVFGRRGVVVSVCVVASVWGFGVYRLSTAPATESFASFNAQLVQGNVPQRTKWNPSYTNSYLHRHIDLTEMALSSDVDFVVWPETAVIHFLDENKYLREVMVDSLNEGQFLVVGAPRRERIEGERTKYFNSIFVLDSTGEIVDSYDKKWLVPFGEYIPWREYMPKFVREMIYRREDYQSGSGGFDLKVAGVEMLPLICFEAVSPFLASQNASGKDALLVLTNDAWFDGTIGPYQHFAMVRMRAVELGLPLMRGANTGVTAKVNKFGRVENRIDMGQKGVLK